MAYEVVIPIFPCRSLKETLEFYVALGFSVTYEQHAPYVYGAVRYEDIELHFYGSEKVPPNAESGHIALIHVLDIDALHKAFSGGLKTAFGKGLRTGIPRLGRVNSLPKERRFNLVDPAGNRLIVSQSTRRDQPKRPLKSVTPLSRVVQAGRLDAYSRDAPEIAARYVDEALREIDLASEPGSVRFRAFVLRADVAGMLEDSEGLEKYTRLARETELEARYRSEVAEELERLAELEAALHS